MLTVDGISKAFGDDAAVDGLSLRVEDDEIVALLGPSGCGKTTTLRCIAGLLEPDTGHILIGDEDLTSAPPQERHLGMVFQSSAVWPHKTVYENVVFPLKYTSNSFDPADYEARVDEILDLVEIRPLKQKLAMHLSGGEQQRTALARALVHNPSLLLLDEPFSSLDENLRVTMRDELQRIQEETGTSMLYVTHNQNEALYLADAIVLMHGGQVVERGTPEELYFDPEYPFTREFLGDWNALSGVRATDAVETPLGSIREEQLADGKRLAEVDRGGDVLVYLHQKDVRWDAGGNGRIPVQGRVLASGINKGNYEVSLQVDGSRVKVKSDEPRDLSIGDTVECFVDPADLEVYGGRHVGLD